MPGESNPKLYIFNCPVHGLEYGAHCFRASDPNHLDRWYVTPLVLNKPTNSDLEEIKLQSSFTRNPKRWSIRDRPPIQNREEALP